MRWTPLVILVVGCRGPVQPPPSGASPPPAPPAWDEPVEQPPDDADAFERPDPARDTGWMLRPMGDGRWGVRARIPISVGWTAFDFDTVSLDNLTTLAAVPMVELPIALDERWTVAPYMGLGAAFQSGDGDLLAGQRTLGLYRAGAYVQRWEPFGERHAWLAKGEVRYDAVLNGRDGLLGDWGSVDAAVELRTILGSPNGLGSPTGAPRVQPGIYIQGIHFWQAVQLEIEGVSPEFVDNQIELGVSLGTDRPLKILGITLPRMFVGVRAGDEIRGLRIRFGRL